MGLGRMPLVYHYRRHSRWSAMLQNGQAGSDAVGATVV